MHAGLSFSKAQRAEATTCLSKQDCQNFFCASGKAYCFDGVCKCGEPLKAEATTCQSNEECQKVCESGGFCVDGKCSCT